jgi:hypothetical protein
MSQRLTFFRAVSTLFQNQCLDALDYCLAETDDLIAQIQYQKQVDAPFWHLLLRADGTVVQICRNFAGYFGETPQSLSGRSLWQFLMPDHPGQAQVLARQALETGLAVSRVFPTRYGGEFGVVCCRVPWLQQQLGDLVAMLWPLTDEGATAAFAFRSLDGLRVIMFLDIRGHILAVDPLLAGRLGRTPRLLAGCNLFELFPPDKARRRWASFQETAWTGRPVELLEKGETGVRYDLYKVPVFGHDGHVVRVLVLAREHQRAFQEVQASSAVHSVE